MSRQNQIKLKIIPAKFGVLKLPPPQPFPDWLKNEGAYFLSQTEDEFSIICPMAWIPASVAFSSDWRCIRVDGSLDFEQVGVAAAVSEPLARAGISLILVGTHDRDYVLVKQTDLEKTIAAYQNEGFQIV